MSIHGNDFAHTRSARGLGCLRDIKAMEFARALVQ
jgi:hypothetical protein